MLQTDSSVKISMQSGLYLKSEEQVQQKISRPILLWFDDRHRQFGSEQMRIVSDAVLPQSGLFQPVVCFSEVCVDAMRYRLPSSSRPEVPC